jgi:hypothetical protein
MLGASWGSKGRSAVAAPWLPPASCASTMFKHAQKSRCIAATAFIIFINFHSTVEIFQKLIAVCLYRWATTN